MNNNNYYCWNFLGKFTTVVLLTKDQVLIVYELIFLILSTRFIVQVNGGWEYLYFLVNDEEFFPSSDFSLEKKCALINYILVRFVNYGGGFMKVTKCYNKIQ